MKDAKLFLDVLGNVLRVPRDRTHLVVNHRASQSGMTASDVEQVLGLPVAFEIGHDGVRPERAAMKGELVVLSQQRSAIGRAVTQLAQTIDQQRPAADAAPAPEPQGRSGWFGYALG